MRPRHDSRVWAQPQVRENKGTSLRTRLSRAGAEKWPWDGTAHSVTSPSLISAAPDEPLTLTGLWGGDGVSLHLASLTAAPDQPQTLLCTPSPVGVDRVQAAVPSCIRLQPSRTAVTVPTLCPLKVSK